MYSLGGGDSVFFCLVLYGSQIFHSFGEYLHEQFSTVVLLVLLLGSIEYWVPF